MTDSESSHHSRLPPYGFALRLNLASFLSVSLSDLMDGSLDLSSGVPAAVIFLRYPLITHHLVFMAQVFITTLLIARWLNDEDFPQQYALPKWNYPP